MPRPRAKSELSRLAKSEARRKPIYDLLEKHPNGLTMDEMDELLDIDKIYLMIGAMVHRDKLIGIYAGKNKKNGTRVKTYFLPKYAPELDDIYRIEEKESFALGSLFNIPLPNGTKRKIEEKHPSSGLKPSAKNHVNVSLNLANWPNM